MRPLEAVFLMLVLAVLVASLPFKKARPQVALRLGLAAAAFGALQAIVEKSRWQLYPAYLVLVLFGIAAFFAGRRQAHETNEVQRRRWPRILAFVSGLLGLGISALMATLLPVFSFATPTGPLAIGVTSYEWVDQARTDEHPTKPSGHRRLVVKVWYPAANSSVPNEPYFDAVHAEGLAHAVKMPGFVLSHLRLVKTNAHREIPLPVGGERFPVVLYSHGYPLPADAGTFAAEELASQGYVVVGINHTYDTAAVFFQDGTTATVEIVGDATRFDAVEKILGPRLSVWVADARFVVNELAKLDATDPRFKGRLDLEHIGYFGHSFGGATAWATLAADPRIKAAINMDGAHLGAAAQAQSTQPFMLMRGEMAQVSDAQLAQVGATRQEVDAFLNEMQRRWSTSVAPGKTVRYDAKFTGVSHLGFSDVPLMMTLAARDPVPPPKTHQLVNQYILAFFNQHLKGVSSPLLSGRASDPPVNLTVVPPAVEKQ